METDPRFAALLRFFEGLPRQGPGDDRYTEHLYALLDLPPAPRTADLGSGSGAASLVLARLGAEVTAVDIHRPFLAQLEATAAAAGLGERVRTLTASMDDLPAGTGPFDLVWSEGAVYIIGFDRGLALWRDLVVPGGYLVVSEMTWLEDDPPEGAKGYWEKAYPAMRTVAENEAAVRAAGYAWLGSVRLPDATWETFFRPQRERCAEWRARGPTPEEAAAIEEIEEEIRLFEAYPEAFGYVFYLMRWEG